MNNSTKPSNENRRNLEAKVINVINDSLVVLNKGSKDNVKIGDNYYVYYLSDEDIVDLDTGYNYGKIEHVIGKGTIVHVQEHMAQLESNSKDVRNNKKIVRTNSPMMIMGAKEEEIFELDEIKLPFDSPKVGYFARKY